jgi:hypothetical protein
MKFQNFSLTALFFRNVNAMHDEKSEANVSQIFALNIFTLRKAFFLLLIPCSLAEKQEKCLLSFRSVSPILSAQWLCRRQKGK